MADVAESNGVVALPAGSTQTRQALALSSAAKIPNATISRLSHDVRRPRKLRQALEGWPRWATLAARPRSVAPRANVTSIVREGEKTVAATEPTPSCVSTSIQTRGQ